MRVKGGRFEGSNAYLQELKLNRKWPSRSVAGTRAEKAECRSRRRLCNRATAANSADLDRVAYVLLQRATGSNGATRIHPSIQSSAIGKRENARVARATFWRPLRNAHALDKFHSLSEWRARVSSDLQRFTDVAKSLKRKINRNKGKQEETVCANRSADIVSLDAD